MHKSSCQTGIFTSHCSEANFVTDLDVTHVQIHQEHKFACFNQLHIKLMAFCIVYREFCNNLNTFSE